MTWRIARFHVEIDALTQGAAAAPPARISAAFPVRDRSLLSGLKQHFSSDEELAEQLQSGETDALGVLFNRHSGLLFGIARRILRNNTDAEDAVQQIFLDVFRSIHQFDREKGTFKTWLLMFAYHRTFNSRRSQIAKRFFNTDPLEEGIPECQAEPRGRSIAENSILAGQLLKSLNPRQRRTIELVYYEGLTPEEISVRTGDSIRVVRHNLYRGLEKLRNALRAERRPGSHEGGDR
jgi:RNA polymerase sigma-70 factor (ECF subfamily)